MTAPSTAVCIILIILVAGTIRVAFAIATRNKTPAWIRWVVFVAALWACILQVRGCQEAQKGGKKQPQTSHNRVIEEELPR